MLSDEQLTAMREQDSARQGRYLNQGEADRHELLCHIDHIVLEHRAIKMQLDALRKAAYQMDAGGDEACVFCHQMWAAPHATDCPLSTEVPAPKKHPSLKELGLPPDWPQCQSCGRVGDSTRRIHHAADCGGRRRG